jgi:hypothetical protein
MFWDAFPGADLALLKAGLHLALIGVGITSTSFWTESKKADKKYSLDPSAERNCTGTA